tara:strand:+ start:692 stop:1294 length:603 start_codon:yes stop_codon:yes gene_type:complete
MDVRDAFLEEEMFEQHFCRIKAEEFSREVERMITPQEMYLLGIVGGYHRLSGMMWNWPRCFLIMLDEVCDSFRAFSPWWSVRTPGIPRTEAELAAKNDEWVPYREMLLRQVDNRLDHYASCVQEILEYFHEDWSTERKIRRAYMTRLRWKRVAAYVCTDAIIWFWKRITYRPGGLAFLRDIRELIALGMLTRTSDDNSLH